MSQNAAAFADPNNNDNDANTPIPMTPPSTAADGSSASQQLQGQESVFFQDDDDNVPQNAESGGGENPPAQQQQVGGGGPLNEQSDELRRQYLQQFKAAADAVTPQQKHPHFDVNLGKQDNAMVVVVDDLPQQQHQTPPQPWPPTGHEVLSDDNSSSNDLGSRSANEKDQGPAKPMSLGRMGMAAVKHNREIKKKQYKVPEDHRTIPKQPSLQRFGPNTMLHYPENFQQSDDSSDITPSGSDAGTRSDDSEQPNHGETEQERSERLQRSATIRRERRAKVRAEREAARAAEGIDRDTAASFRRKKERAKEKKRKRKEWRSTRKPLSQFELVDPTFVGDTPLPYNTRLTDRAGRYFLDEPEDHFFATTTNVSVNDHADGVLRRIGLIKQVGWKLPWRLRSCDLLPQEIYYDERVCLWRRQDTNYELALKATDIFARKDAAPAGLVSVVGTLDCKSFIPPEEKLEEENRKKETERELSNASGLINDRLRSSKQRDIQGGQFGVGGKSFGASSPTGKRAASGGMRNRSKSVMGSWNNSQQKLTSPTGSAGGSNAQRKREMRKAGKRQDGNPLNNGQNDSGNNSNTNSVVNPSLQAAGGGKGRRGRRNSSGTFPPTPAANASPGKKGGASKNGFNNQPITDAEFQKMRAFDGYDVRIYDNDDNDIESIIDIGDPTAEFLNRGEVLKFIKHYLCRGIVNTAKGTKSSIVTSGVDDLSRLLAQGHNGLLDPMSIKTFNPNEVPTLLVGINPACLAVDLDMNFSRHVLVSADGGHEFSNLVGLGDLSTPALEQNDKEGDLEMKEPTTPEQTKPSNDSINFARPESPLVVRGKVVSEEGFCLKCGVKYSPALRWGYCQVSAPFATQYSKVGTSLNHPPNTVNPTPEHFVAFKQALLETINQGFREDRTLNAKQPPNRPSVPVVVVLIGGTDVTAHEVRQAVSRGWPILAVAGSGGFASRICSAVRKINDLDPDAGPDQFRKLLGGVDGVTAEIINNGKLEVIAQGTSVDQFQRLLNNALKGDQILHQAWFLYSMWSHNADEFRYLWQLSSIALLLIGIAATLVSVIQTFMILYWKAVETDYPAQWAQGIIRQEDKFLYLFYTMCQWLVIGLPIMLTLLHAIFQRLNPWGKLSALRIASDGLLREIYFYRTRTQRYSNAAVRKAKKKGKGSLGNSVSASASAAEAVANAQANAQGNNAEAQDDFVADITYSSREELLGIMVSRLQNTLMMSEIKEVALKVPDDTIPPRRITEFGDTGFYDLSPDDYVKYRLLPAKVDYQNGAASLSVQLTVLMSAVIVWSAVGTTIAALSAYGLGYLQAWVAFTTAMVNSMNRFLDSTRLASLTELNNATVHKLSDVERWWTALGTGADDDANRSKLVTDTEGILREELEDWAKQLQTAQEEMKQQEEEHKKAQAAAKAQREAEQQRENKAMSELGIEALTPASIESALSNPSGTQALKLKQQLLVLDDKLGNVIAAEAEEQPRPSGAGGADGDAQPQKGTENAVLDAETKAVLDQLDTVPEGGAGFEKTTDDSAPPTTTASSGATHSGTATPLHPGGRPPKPINKKSATTGGLFNEGALGEKMSTIMEGSGQVRVLFLDTKLRSHLLRAFNDLADMDVRDITSFSLRKILSLFSGEVSHALQLFFTSKEVLQISRTLIGATLMEIFKGIFLDRDGIRLHESLTEKFISNFAQIAATCDPSINLSQGTVCQLSKDPTIKQLLLEASPETVDAIVDVARRIFSLTVEADDSDYEDGPLDSHRSTTNNRRGSRRNESPTQGLNSSFRMKYGIHAEGNSGDQGAFERHLYSENGLKRAYGLYYAMSNELAHLEVERVAQNPTSYLAHMAVLAKLEEHAVNLATLTKQQILMEMPPSLRKEHINKSQLELLCFITQLSVGSSATRAFRECALEIRALLQSEQGMTVFTNIVSREVFVSASMIFTQEELNVMEKGDILRKLQGANVMTDSVMSIVSSTMTDTDLRDSISMLQAAQSNSFDTRMIDELSDLFSLVDLRGSLSQSDKEELVRAVGRLPRCLCPYPHPERPISHDEILKIIPSASSIEIFAPLQTHQLQSLILQMRLLLNNPYFEQVWLSLKASIDSDVKFQIMDRLSPLGAQRLCFSVWRMSPQDIREIDDCRTIVEALRKVNDRVVSEELITVCPDSTKETQYRWEFGELVNDIAEATRGQIVNQVWEKCMRKVRAIYDDKGVAPEIFEVLRHIRHNLGKLLENSVALLKGDHATFKSFLRNMEVPDKTLPAAILDSADVFSSFVEVAKNIVVAASCDISYAFFCQMALSVERFDLWDLFPTSVVRHALPMVLAILALDHQGTSDFFNFETRDEDGVYNCDESVVKTKKFEFLNAIQALEDPTDKVARVADVLNCLRLLTQSQVKRLIHIATHTIHRTELGGLLKAQCLGFASSDATTNMRQVLTSLGARVIACANVFAAANRGDPMALQEACCKYDWTAFVAEPVNKKKEYLRRVVPDEVAIDAVSAFTAPEALMLFTILYRQTKMNDELLLDLAYEAARSLDNFKNNERKHRRQIAAALQQRAGGKFSATSSAVGTPAASPTKAGVRFAPSLYSDSSDDDVPNVAHDPVPPLTITQPSLPQGSPEKLYDSDSD